MRLNTVEFLSFGEERIYAKEQALIDLLQEELAAGRPCVVYLRQTATRDIQPRIEALIRRHVPGARPYILRNTVAAERREKVIGQQVAAGINVVIANPELVKTGLDLIHFPTLIFYEITFNLGTMMQAAARAWRLNQTHAQCKTCYLFAQGTMEHTAVQLMSRKQRAAKLLAGDIGLTGLDALTEGESGFEEALLDAIARDEALLDPSAMFQVSAGQSALDAEDAAYWNVAIALAAEAEAETAHEVHDPLILAGMELGAVLVEEEALPELVSLAKSTPSQEAARLLRYVGRYLDTVHLIHDEAKRARLQAKLLSALTDGVQSEDSSYAVVGLRDPDFTKFPVHAEKLIRYVRGWLKQQRFVFMGCEAEVAAQVVELAQQALGLKPTQLDVFQALQDAQTESLEQSLPAPATPEPPSPRPFAPRREAEPVQLAMF